MTRHLSACGLEKIEKGETCVPAGIRTSSHLAAGTLDTNWFTQNRALNGGSVWQNGCRDAVHRNNRFDNNTAERGSAGVEMNQVASIDVSSCTFNGGRGAKGSGLYLQVCSCRALFYCCMHAPSRAMHALFLLLHARSQPHHACPVFTVACTLPAAPCMLLRAWPCSSIAMHAPCRCGIHCGFWPRSSSLGCLNWQNCSGPQLALQRHSPCTVGPEGVCRQVASLARWQLHTCCIA